MSKWKPIETAPKDGTNILTYGLGHGVHKMTYDVNEKPFTMFVVAYWYKIEGETEVEVQPGLYRKEPATLLEGWKAEWSYRPTHWMPLPAPPAVSSNALNPDEAEEHIAENRL